MRRSQQMRRLVPACVLAASVTLAGLVLVGCAAVGATTGSIDGTWRLVGGTDYAGQLHLHHIRVTLTVDGANSRGDGPCNAYGASISSSRTGRVSIRRGVTTTMACAEQSRNAMEARYFRDLGNVDVAHLNAGDLWLVGSNASLQFARSRG